MAAPATTIIFVATNTCLLLQNTCLSLENYVYRDKLVILVAAQMILAAAPASDNFQVSIV